MNKYKIKKTIGMLISVIPSNFVRILLYRLLFKYKIESSAKIGYLTIIAVDEAIIKEKVNIGTQNLFLGPYKLEIDAEARMGNKNELICDDWVLDNKFENCGYLFSRM